MIEGNHQGLMKIQERLKPYIDSSEIKGTGVGQFLIVVKGDRGAEIYFDKNGDVIVDPAVGDNLQGEIVYSSIEHAYDATFRWINKADYEEIKKDI